MQLDMAQMPGQPITFTVANLDTTGAFPAAATATTQPLEFRLRKYGCQVYADADFNASNPEFNPFQELSPDGTAFATFTDATRGRINFIPAGAAAATTAADAPTYVATLPVQNNFLQNLEGENGILGRCITVNAWEVAPQAPGDTAAFTGMKCDIVRTAAPTAFPNPQFTPTHQHFYPQQYNRYPSFPRYNNYSRGGVY